MRMIPTNKIFTIKRRDQQIKSREIKYEALCPNHAFYNPCINLIKNNYCPYWHIEDCRKAYCVSEECFQNGQEPDEQTLLNIVTQNSLTTEDKQFKIKLFRKYPSYPDNEALQFIENFLKSP